MIPTRIISKNVDYPMAGELRDMSEEDMEIEELVDIREALARLIEREDLFREVAKAVEREDAERFRAVLSELGIIRFCWVICRWFCAKRRSYACIDLCPDVKPTKPTVEEMLEFGHATVKITADKGAFKGLYEAYKQNDAVKFQAILKEFDLQRFCVQFCLWFSHIYCRSICAVFCPPIAKITSPSGLACVQPKAHKVDEIAIFGVEIRGIASGSAPFSYKLEYSSDAGLTWRQDAPGSGDIIVVYPDGHRGGASTVPVGPPPDVLGYLDATNLSPATYHIRLTVTGGGVTATDTALFQLHQKPVGIDEVGRIEVALQDSSRKLLLDGMERAVGGYATIGGSAKVEGCGHRYKKYKLMMAKGWVSPPSGTDYDAIGPPWEVLKNLDGNDVEIDYTGKSVWALCFLNQPVGDLTVKWGQGYCLSGFPVPIGPFDRLIWRPWQTILAGMEGERSGKYTILLAVKDDAVPPNTYIDYLDLWLDNRTLAAYIEPPYIPKAKPAPCQAISISAIMKAGGIMEIRGTAWDELIDPSLPTDQPNLNFDHFDVLWKKDGLGYKTDGITLTGAGKTRIKDDVIATWDIRDPANPSKPRTDITPCSYIFKVRVWDNSRVNDHTSHYAEWDTGLCITE